MEVVAALQSGTDSATLIITAEKTTRLRVLNDFTFKKVRELRE
jgi:hypothetical protein